MEKQELQVIGQGSVPAFVEEQMKSLDGAMLYANALLKSKMCPAHFYEKGSDNKPDYSKGRPEAVLMVLQHGKEIGLSYMQSLQQIVPVNGLVSIKGDGAKSLIMGSGLAESWKEEYVGTEGKDDWGCTITSKRKGTGETHSVTFTVTDAKRAGLWVTEDMAARTPHLKYGGWYKYPKRMLRYRALGFIARDMYSDVLQGTFIEEEARDIDVDNTIVKTETGMVVDHTKIEKTDKTTEKAKEEKPKSSRIQAGKIEDAKIIEETKAEPKKSILEGIETLKGPELWQRVVDNWNLAIDPMSLFTTANPRNVTATKALLNAIDKGTLVAHLSEKYGISIDPIQKNIAEVYTEGTGVIPSEGVSTIPEWITQPSSTGRPMPEAVKVSEWMETTRQTAQEICDMYPDNFNDVEDMFVHITIEQLVTALS